MCDEDAVFKEVRRSGRYAAVCEQTVRAVIRSKLNRYKSTKQTVKAVKAELHQTTQMFAGDSGLNRAREIVAGIAPTHNDLRAVLGMHTSTAERMPFFEEMYTDIFNATGHVESVWDIACGFNPFAIPFVPGLANAYYRASDINIRIVELIGDFFIKADVKGNAVCSDIFEHIPVGGVDIVFLLKILPILERRKKGFGAALVGLLDCRFVVISFPTKSMSARNVGMSGAYRAYMDKNFIGFRRVFEKEYSNEIVFIIEK